MILSLFQLSLQEWKWPLNFTIMWVCHKAKDLSSVLGQLPKQTCQIVKALASLCKHGTKRLMQYTFHFHIYWTIQITKLKGEVTKQTRTHGIRVSDNYFTSRTMVNEQSTSYFEMVPYQGFIAPWTTGMNRKKGAFADYLCCTQVKISSCRLAAYNILCVSVMEAPPGVERQNPAALGHKCRGSSSILIFSKTG